MKFNRLIAGMAVATLISGSAFAAPTKTTIVKLQPKAESPKATEPVRSAGKVKLRPRQETQLRRALASENTDQLVVAVDNLIPSNTSTGRLGLTTECAAEMTGDSTLDNHDLYAFVDFYYAGDARADVNANGQVSVQDVLDYIGMYLVGCPTVPVSGR